MNVFLDKDLHAYFILRRITRSAIITDKDNDETRSGCNDGWARRSFCGYKSHGKSHTFDEESCEEFAILLPATQFQYGGLCLLIRNPFQICVWLFVL